MLAIVVYDIEKVEKMLIAAVMTIAAISYR